jgi:hypothetical protein
MRGRWCHELVPQQLLQCASYIGINSALYEIYKSVNYIIEDWRGL